MMNVFMSGKVTEEYPTLQLKFLFEAHFLYLPYDQAACIYDALAWSFAQSRVFDPPSVSDACQKNFLTHSRKTA